MKDWYYIKILIIGVLIGIGFLMCIYAAYSYFTQGKVTLVPTVEYRDKIVYANNPCPSPSASPNETYEVAPKITETYPQREPIYSNHSSVKVISNQTPPIQGAASLEIIVPEDPLPIPPIQIRLDNKNVF